MVSFEELVKREASRVQPPVGLTAAGTDDAVEGAQAADLRAKISALDAIIAKVAGSDDPDLQRLCSAKELSRRALRDQLSALKPIKVQLAAAVATRERAVKQASELADQCMSLRILLEARNRELAEAQTAAAAAEIEVQRLAEVQRRDNMKPLEGAASTALSALPAALPLASPTALAAAFKEALGAAPALQRSFVQWMAQQQVPDTAEVFDLEAADQSLDEDMFPEGGGREDLATDDESVGNFLARTLAPAAAAAVATEAPAASGIASRAEGDPTAFNSVRPFGRRRPAPYDVPDLTATARPPGAAAMAEEGGAAANTAPAASSLEPSAEA